MATFAKMLRRRDFAAIADWFWPRFHLIGLTGIVWAGIAAAAQADGLSNLRVAALRKGRAGAQRPEFLRNVPTLRGSSVHTMSRTPLSGESTMSNSTVLEVAAGFAARQPDGRLLVALTDRVTVRAAHVVDATGRACAVSSRCRAAPLAMCVAIALAGCASVDRPPPDERYRIEGSGPQAVIHHPAERIDRVIDLHLGAIESKCSRIELQGTPVGALALHRDWSLHSFAPIRALFHVPPTTGTPIAPDAVYAALRQAKAGDCLRSVDRDIELDTALALAAEAIVDVLPRTSQQDLKRQFGYDTTKRAVDIQPGMRLRIDHSGPLSPDNVHSGTLAAPVFLYFTGHREGGDARLIVGPVEPLARLAGPRQEYPVGEPGGPESELCYGNIPGGEARPLNVLYQASGPADLLPPEQTPWRAWRLFFPREWLSSFIFYAGGCHPVSVSTDRKVVTAVLVAATSRENLDETDSDAFRDGGANPCGGKNRCFVFQARGVPTAEISVSVNGAQEWVAVGTTLEDLMRRGWPVRPSTAGMAVDPSDQLAAARLERARTRGLLKQISLRRRAGGQLVAFDMSRADPLAVLGIALLPGDDIRW
jgi:hypothetical protein